MIDVATLTLAIELLPDTGIFVRADGPGGWASGRLVLPDDLSFHEAQARLAGLQASAADIELIGRQLFATLFVPPLDRVYTQTQARLGADQRLRLVLLFPI